jgi:hypothetical protein
LENQCVVACDHVTTDSRIVHNSSSAIALEGAAAVQGAGISNNGPLVLANDRVSGNTASADGQSGFVQGGGISTGVFGGPTSPLTIQDTAVTGNTLTGSAGVTLSGAGIYTVGFPTTLTNSVVAFNRPDQCDGC